MSADLHRDSCIDAERFAAWVDGGLPAEEAAAVESHLADCVRCQAMMAAFAKTDLRGAAREPAPAILPFWRRPSVRWGLPLAAAASVVIGVAVSRRPPPVAPVQDVARVESAPRVEAPIAPSQAGEQAPSALAEPKTPSPARPSQAVANRRAEAPPADQREASVKGSVAAVPLPPVAVPDPGGVAETVVTTLASRRERVVVNEFSSENPAMSRLSDAAPAAAPARAQGRSASASAPPPPSAPPPAHMRWRIFSDGRVEHAQTSENTWRIAAIDQGLGVKAGAAPQASICWLVGPAGVVLRSTDSGQTFARADVPGAPDLVAVQAVDASRATVSASNGRTFSTTDGGATWR